MFHGHAYSSRLSSEITNFHVDVFTGLICMASVKCIIGGVESSYRREL